jgi:hypothetical protein
MQSGLRWSRSHSRRRFPVVGTPYAPPSARPCGCPGVVALVRRCALCGWSVACGQSCGVCPRLPLCFAASRLSRARWSARPPPKGSLSPRACLLGVGYSFRSAQRKEYRVYRPILHMSVFHRGLISHQDGRSRCPFCETDLPLQQFVQELQLAVHVMQADLHQGIMVAFESLVGFPMHAFGLVASPFKILASQPRRLRSLSALVDARSSESSFCVA